LIRLKVVSFESGSIKGEARRFSACGTRSVVLIGGSLTGKVATNTLAPIANDGKTVFAQFPKAQSIHRGFSY
jgi:hypothetical protein